MRLPWRSNKDPADLEHVKEELSDVQVRVRSLEARVRAMEAAKRLRRTDETEGAHE